MRILRLKLAVLMSAWLLVAVASADIVTDWNQVLINAVRTDTGGASTTPGPTWASRNMAMVQLAICDAVNNAATTQSYTTWAYNGPSPIANQTAAASQAAHDVLVALYPSQSATFDAYLATKLATVPAGQSKTDGINLGAAVAAAVINKRVGDGSANAQTTMPPGAGAAPYTVSFTNGNWQPDPLHPTQTALGPGWGNVTTFGITNGQQFRSFIPAPPVLTSADYATAYNEVMNKGKATGSTRTTQETNIGLAWAYDVGGLGPPMVLYNQIVKQIADAKGNTVGQNARLFALANMAMADAGIVCWDSKYLYNFWRPVTGIRNGGSDGNGATSGDASWLPLGAPNGADPFTPPFPAYASGHSTFGAAMFQTLRDFYGTDAIGFTLVSDEPGTTPIAYGNLTAAQLDNALSRVYLGVHWRFDAVAGIDSGVAVGNYVFANNLTQLPEPSSLVLATLGASSLVIILRRRHGRNRTFRSAKAAA